MTAANCQGLDAHKEKHRDFVDKVVGAGDKFLKGDNSYKMEIVNFLKKWLIEHILGTDKKFMSLVKLSGTYSAAKYRGLGGAKAAEIEKQASKPWWKIW